MEWLSQNWVWLALTIGIVFMMRRGGHGGCCGGSGHGGGNTSREPGAAPPARAVSRDAEHQHH